MTVIGVPVATVWTAPDAPRPQDGAAVADVPDVAAWTEAMDATARGGLHGRTLTQGLLGEPVEVVTERGDWAEVVLLRQPASAHPRGYPGWVRKAHLASEMQPDFETDVIVTAATSTATTRDGALRLSYGTRLSMLARDLDHVRVALPGSRTATLPCGDVWLPGHRADAFGLPTSARRFLGLHYLWGGTSAWGLDCSGLVHLVHRVHGHEVPRDAFDQHAAAAPVPLDAAAVGDLYFFARAGKKVSHVGFVTNTVGELKTMLHAPEGSGARIEDVPMAEQRLTTLIAAGSFVRGVE